MTSNQLASSSSLPTADSSIISTSVSTSSSKEPSSNLYNISYLLKRMRGERTSKHSLPLIKQQKSSKTTSWLPMHAIRRQSMHHGTFIHKQNSLLSDAILLVDTPEQRETLINTSIYAHNKLSQFPLNRLNKKETKLGINQSDKKRQQKSSTKFFRPEKDEHQQFNNATYCVAYCTVIIIGVTIGGWIGGLFELISGDHNGCHNEHNGSYKCRMNYSNLNVTTHCINIFYTDSILTNPPYICLCRFRNNSKGKYRDCKFLHAKIY